MHQFVYGTKICVRIVRILNHRGSGFRKRYYERIIICISKLIKALERYIILIIIRRKVKKNKKRTKKQSSCSK